MKRLVILSTLTLGAILTGCAGGGGYAVRFGPPPPPRYAIVGRAPGPGFVWTDGYWDRRGSQWVWTDGRWLRPPRAHATWVPGSWRQENRGWRFHRGYWR